MKLIIFDIDGTLTDTKEVEGRCFIKAFEQTFGMNLQDQDWSTFQNVTDWGITEEAILENFKRLPSSKEYEEMITNFIVELEAERNKDENQFKEIPGAKAFFQSIQSNPFYQIGIATGAWEKSAIFKLDAIGIKPKGIAFANSNDYKSREEITKYSIRQAKHQSKEEIQEIIYFGDGEWDFKTCKNLGIRFIGIDVLNDGKLKKLGAKAVFNDFKNPKEILAEINNF